MSAGASIATMMGQYALMNVMQGKDAIPANLNPFSKGGGGMEMPETPGGGAGSEGGGILQSLGEGLDALGTKPGKKLMGIVVLGALVAVMGAAFAAAMYMLGDVDPVTMIAFSASIGILGATLALMGMISGNVIMGALALGIVAIALIPAAYAMSMLAGVDAGAMLAFSASLGILSLAAAGLGFLAPFVIMGAAAIAILGLAIIPAAQAFGQLEGLDTQAILSFSTGVGILAVTVAGLGYLAPFILAGAFALTVLGLALGPISDGFAKLGQTPMGDMISGINELGMNAPALVMVGVGLMSIAAGLGAIAIAGMLAMPGIGLLIALATVAPALTGLAETFGFGGGSDDSAGGGDGGGDSELLEEIKGLRSDIQAQPIQIVMGNKVISEFSKVQNAKNSRRIG